MHYVHFSPESLFKIINKFKNNNNFKNPVQVLQASVSLHN